MSAAALSSNGNHAGAGVRLWRRIWNTPWPTVGCEISATGVSAARWSPSTASFDSAAWKPIPPGCVEASPLRENIRSSQPVRDALRSALSAIGVAPGADSRRQSDAVLVIPDQAARLFAFTLDSLPKRQAEALSLVQFRLKKSVPFDIESAAVSYKAYRSADQWEVIAVASPQPVVRQYESLLESCGLRPRCIVLSTLATLGLLPEAQHRGGNSAGPGVLVAKYSPPWFTTAILQRGQVRLFRTVGMSAGPDGLLSAETVLEALYPSMVFFQDNFGGKLEAARLCGLGETRSVIAELLGRDMRVETFPLSANGTLGSAAPDPALREVYFSGLLGVLEQNARAA
jgi:type IV pilus assembly protein PilM